MTTAPPAPATSNGYVPDRMLHQPTNGAPSVPGARLPKVRRPRRPALAAAGALLVVLCAVASAALATAGHDRARVLALAHDVSAGHLLTASDLRVAELSGSGLQALSADSASTLIGQTVTATLPTGTLLNPSMVTAVPLPGAGLQLVAVAVKPGGVPQQALPGRDVSLIRVSNSGSGGQLQGAPTVLVAKARLVSVDAEAATGLTVLSVQVPQDLVVAVAQASAAGAIAVTLLPVAP